MPHLQDGIGLCCKSFLLEARISPRPQGGVHGTKIGISHPQLITSTHGGDHPSLLGHSLCAVSCLLPRGEKETGNCGGFIPSNCDSMVGLGGCQLSYGETGRRWRIDMCPTAPFCPSVCLCTQLPLCDSLEER